MEDVLNDTRYPKTADEVFQLLAYGNANRRQSPTEANATSSRSHAVLQVHLSLLAVRTNIAHRY